MAGLDLGTVAAVVRLRTDQLQADGQTASGIIRDVGREFERLGTIVAGVTIAESVLGWAHALEELPRALVQTSAQFEQLGAGMAAAFEFQAKQIPATMAQAAAEATATLQKDQTQIQQAAERYSDLFANRTQQEATLARSGREADEDALRRQRELVQQQHDFVEDQTRSAQRGAEDRVLHDRDAQAQLTRQLTDYTAQWNAGAAERASTFARSLDTVTSRHADTLRNLEAEETAALARFRTEAAQAVSDAADRLDTIHARLTDRQANLQLSAQQSAIEYAFRVQDLQSRAATATRPDEQQAAQRELGRAQVLRQLQLQRQQLQERELQEQAAREEQEVQRQEARRLAALRREEQQQAESHARRAQEADANLQRERATLQTEYTQRESVAQAAYDREVANAQAAAAKRAEVDQRAWTRQAEDRQVAFAREERDYAEHVAALADESARRTEHLTDEAAKQAQVFEQQASRLQERQAGLQDEFADKWTRAYDEVFNRGRATARMFSDEWTASSNATIKALGGVFEFQAPSGTSPFERSIDEAKQMQGYLLDLERQVPTDFQKLTAAALQLQGGGIDPLHNSILRTIAALSSLPQVGGDISRVARAVVELSQGATGQAERLFRTMGLSLHEIPGLTFNAANHLTTDLPKAMELVEKYLGERSDTIIKHLQGTYVVLQTSLTTAIQQFQLIAGDQLFGETKKAIDEFLKWMQGNKPVVQEIASTLGAALGEAARTITGWVRQLGEPQTRQQIADFLAQLGQIKDGVTGAVKALLEPQNQAAIGEFVSQLGGLKDAVFGLGGAFHDAFADQSAALPEALDKLSRGNLHQAITRLQADGRDYGQIWNDVQAGNKTAVQGIAELQGTLTQQQGGSSSIAGFTTLLKEGADGVKSLSDRIHEFAESEAFKQLTQDFKDFVPVFGTFVEQLGQAQRSQAAQQIELVAAAIGKVYDWVHAIGQWLEQHPQVGQVLGVAGQLGAASAGLALGGGPALAAGAVGAQLSGAFGPAPTDPAYAAPAGTSNTTATFGGTAPTTAAGAHQQALSDLQTRLRIYHDTQNDELRKTRADAEQWADDYARGTTAGIQRAFGADATYELRHFRDEVRNILDDIYGHSIVNNWVRDLGQFLPRQVGQIADQAGAAFGGFTGHVERSLGEAADHIQTFGRTAGGRAAGASGTFTATLPGVPAAATQGQARLAASAAQTMAAFGLTPEGHDMNTLAEWQKAVQHEAANQAASGSTGFTSGFNYGGGSLPTFGGNTQKLAQGLANFWDQFGEQLDEHGLTDVRRRTGFAEPGFNPAIDVPRGYGTLTQGGAVPSGDLGGGLSGAGGGLSGGLSGAGGLGVPLPLSASALTLGATGGSSVPVAATGGFLTVGGGYDPQAAKAAAALLLAGTGYGGSGQQAFGIQGTAGLTYDQLYGRNPDDRRAVGATGAYNGVEAAALNQNPNAYVPPAAYNPAGSQYRAGVQIGGSLYIQQTDTGLIRDVVGTLRQEVETNA